MRWYIKLIIILVIVLVGWLIYSNFIKTDTSETKYQTAIVEKGSLVSIVSASGQVSSANNTPVVTQVTGVITKLFVKNGDKVNSGTAIATIDLDQTSRQKYLQQLSAYQSAKNSLESAKNAEGSLRAAVNTAKDSFIKNALNKGKDEDNVTYIQLKADLDLAEDKFKNQADVIKQAEYALSNASMSLQQMSSTITAPISGVITGLSLQAGSVIPAQAISSGSNQITSQNLASITTSNYPIVTVNLTEIDVPKVKIGDKATLTFDAFPDKTFTGKVFSINTTGSVSSGVTSYPVTINLDIENPEIYANMSAVANIIVDNKDNVLLVPLSAVQGQKGEETVRMLKNGKIENVSVETGISSDAYLEIVSGLAEGDEVVTSIISATPNANSTGTSPFGVFRTGGMRRPN